MDLLNYSLISFDCYGTLIDWEKGILQALKPLLETHLSPPEPSPSPTPAEAEGKSPATRKKAPAKATPKKLTDAQILEMYGRFETEAESGKFKPYRQIQAEVMDQFGKELGFKPSKQEAEALADSLANWKPFADTVKALQHLKKYFRLGIISNVDRSQIEGTVKNLKVPFDYILTSEEIGAYKPSLKNFQYASTAFEVNKAEWLHVAQSLFHDVAPAKEFGLDTVWVNRNKGKKGAVPESSVKADLEVASLRALAAMV